MRDQHVWHTNQKREGGGEGGGGGRYACRSRNSAAFPWSLRCRGYVVRRDCLILRPSCPKIRFALCATTFDAEEFAAGLRRPVEDVVRCPVEEKNCQLSQPYTKGSKRQKKCQCAQPGRRFAGWCLCRALCAGHQTHTAELVLAVS